MSTTFHATSEATGAASRRRGLRYMPGLDGMRALAVIAVMVYHADSEWLPGGFLGVEVFFVISGYLITLLLLDEFERTGTIDLGRFWWRRAKRLLPALFVLLFLVLVVTALFRSDELGRVRGDLIAGFAYVSNWYQIWADQGYAAVGEFAPLRHLWSLAVEEQFYIVWPLVMLALFRRRQSWSPALVATWLVTIAVVTTLLVGALHHTGRIADCAVTPEAYWSLGERCVSKADALYLSTITRSSGLLMGAALAFVWRPGLIRRGAHREQGPLLDLLAAAGMATLVVLAFRVHFMTPDGADDVLFRGGFLFTDVATLAVIAAVAHPRAFAGRLIGMRPLRWVGTRSYGLYLYHWPIYQLIRGVAGNRLSFREFVVATAITVVVAELSYQLIERPIRTGEARFWLRRVWYQDDQNARLALGCTAVMCLLVGGVSVARLQQAEAAPNPIAAAIEQGERDVVSVDELLAGASRANAQPTGLASSRPAPSLSVLPTTTVAPTTTAAPSTTAAPTTTVAPTTTAAPSTTAAPTTTVAPTTTAAPTTVAVVVTAAPTAPPTPAPTPPTTEPAVPTTEAPVPSSVPAGGPPATSVPAAGATTTLPATRVPRLAIGDSVMLGAAGALTELGWVVNAEVSRQMIDTGPLMSQLGAAGVFGDVVVVHLGTNGPISDSSLDAVLGPLAGVPRVVLVTVRADRSWTAGNNALLQSRAGGNVVIADWATESNQCVDDCFERDDIHLKPNGRRFYAAMVDRVASGA